MKQIKKILCAALCAVMLLGLAAPARAAADFSDVAGHWAIENIRWARENGVVNGVGGNRFEPNGTVANNAMVKMIVSAFFPGEYAAYEAQNRSAINAHFGGDPGWDGGMNYYAKQAGLLNGVNMDIDSRASANAAMLRYDMALLLANALKLRGVTVSEADKSLAASRLRLISHYYDIPEGYRDVVLTVYASGLINGKGSAGFCGGDTMTRAEACTVIRRMDGLLAGGGTPATPPEPTVKEIVVTTTPNTSGHGANGTAHNVMDNGFATGQLNNGKEINEINVLELLEKAKAVWPASTTWTSDTAYNNSSNNWYQNPSNVMTSALSQANLGTTRGTSSYWGCGGFASMVSDYLFGKTGNPAHKVTDFNNVHPGDIIVQCNADGSPHHVMLVTDVVTTGSHAGAVFCVGNTTDNKIGWPDKTSTWNAWTYENLAAYGSVVVLSRWPESAGGGGGKTPATPPEPTVKDIQVTTETLRNGTTAWKIVDNGFGTGCLNNGKPATEENVIELLHQAEEIWYDGMTWTASGTADNNCYDPASTGSVTIPGLSGNYECGGFAKMLSFYIFGKNANPVHEVTNFADVRPGDIIISKTLNHAMVVIGKIESGRGAGDVYTVEGNSGKQVRWIWKNPNNPYDYWNASGLERLGTFTIYSRYPD